jgi:MFS transporter, MCT family, solute carrier family 16 (monocarboxylic acid transporters), member 3
MATMENADMEMRSFAGLARSSLSPKAHVCQSGPGMSLEDATTTTPTLNRTTTLVSPENATPPIGAINVVSAHRLPDGGLRAYSVIFALGLHGFWVTGIASSWGIVQTQLLRSNSLPSHVSTSTLTFVGALALSLAVSLALLAVRLQQFLGARTVSIVGVVLLGGGELLSGFTTHNLAGLFLTSGLTVGFGMAILYATSNTLPPQYFGTHLGFAHGLVKFGAGIGAIVLSLTTQRVIEGLGIRWMFWVHGLAILATGIPAAFLVNESDVYRALYPINNSRRGRVQTRIDFTLLRFLPFTLLFLSSSLGTFVLFIPELFLPPFALAAGLSATTASRLVAGFNVAATLGRLATGAIADRVGPLNALVAAMLLNGLSALAVWPFSDSVGLLAAFAALNGVANGAFFVLVPTSVCRVVAHLDHVHPHSRSVTSTSTSTSGREAGAMALNVVGWTAGYLLGSPIAGFLLEAAMDRAGTSADRFEDVHVHTYRPAIWYAGALACGSFILGVGARYALGGGVRKRY